MATAGEVSVQNGTHTSAQIRQRRFVHADSAVAPVKLVTPCYMCTSQFCGQAMVHSETAAVTRFSSGGPLQTIEPRGELARLSAASAPSTLRTSNWMSVQRRPAKAQDRSASATPSALP